MPQQLANPQYDAWTCWRQRTSQNGLAVMPVAAAWPQPVAVVALNGGMEFETISFAAVRIGQPPVIPSAGSLAAHPNRLYLGGEQHGVFPCCSLGGVKIYVVGGTYLFSIMAPEGLESDFPLGVSPLDPQPSSVEYLPAALQSDQLVNPTVLPTILGRQEPALPMALEQINDER